MALDAFHHFSRLPKELRDQIWEFAMRKKKPGAHFFTFFNDRDENDVCRLDKGLRVGVRSLTDSLAAPRCDHSNSEHCSWINSNPSTYLIDRGLWTACEESREAMERRFKALQWTIDQYIWPAPAIEYDKSLGRPANASFLYNGEVQHFTTYPGSDLFCLQPFDLDTVNWLGVRIALFQYQIADTVTHVALEYNAEAAGECIEGGQNAWSDFILHAVSDESGWIWNIWLIDYRLRRKNNSTISKTGHEFYGSNRKFVEVHDEDESAWETQTGEGEEGLNIFSFVMLFPGRLDIEGISSGPLVGILACEELD